MSNSRLALLLLMCVALLTGCRVTRHIPEDKAVVSRLDIEVDGRKTGDKQLRMAAGQSPYHRTFGFLPLSAWMWHNDNQTWWHRLRQRLGSEPTVYDEEKALAAERAIEFAMRQKGYLDARVTHRTKVHNRKAHLVYEVQSNLPRTIDGLRYQVDDPRIDSLLATDVPQRLLAHGQLLDRGRLEGERSRLTTKIRDLGYWDFDKENISYIADTLAGSGQVDLTLHISGRHKVYAIHHVHFHSDFNVLTTNEASEDSLQHTRPMERDGYSLTYRGKRCYLTDEVLVRHCYLLPGHTYSEKAVRQTYSSLSQLHILRYVNLRFTPVGEGQLDCDVYLAPQNPYALQFELDGTNTAGDFGFAASLTMQQRNAFRGSEALTFRLKGSYEALSGKVESLVNNNYSEIAGEMSIDFPEFLFPFLSDATRRSSRATSVVKGSFSHQNRPEYTRIIARAGFGYKWSSEGLGARHMWDIVDLSYVNLPQQSDNFRRIVEAAGPLSYSSYTSHLIMSMGYTLNLGNGNLMNDRLRQNVARDVWSLRIKPEIAGNLLQGLSALCGSSKHDGQYETFHLPYEQYACLDIDWSYSHYLSDRSRLAFHGAGSVGVPYGNSRVLPFEKRYYSGGANSVRGWSVRQLGPGRHPSSGGASVDYFNQCGDVRLDMSMELRSRMFWKLEGAVFVDAGNVWTLQDYETQSYGQISSRMFQELAAAWGIGLRMVTDFVVLRLDWGFKAHDPSVGADERWPIAHPFSSSHNTVHFAVGYPF